ncbi:hypothetical protein GCM10009549_10550 [Streptomyces thermoalcalitolerans]|uniref:Uncharacterized protein n=1 Tax=Streptomyces thermoalcalitolerans TaxID=65605 RepID=A0ABN1NFZ0_9ACTN
MRQGNLRLLLLDATGGVVSPPVDSYVRVNARREPRVPRGARRRVGRPGERDAGRRARKGGTGRGKRAGRHARGEAPVEVPGVSGPEGRAARARGGRCAARGAASRCPERTGVRTDRCP